MNTAAHLLDLIKIDRAISTGLLFQSTEGKVIVLNILKNETLAEHITKIPAILVCIDGKAIYTEENKEILMSPGTFINIPENKIHKVTALENSNFLLIK